MEKPVNDLLAWLPTIALFGGLTDSVLKRVIEMMVPQEYRAGEIVCHEGETGRCMFLIRTGEAVVYREGDNGKRLRMVRMGPGEFFGEMTLIDIQKRSATVMIEKQSLIYSLSKKDLYQLYQDDVHGYVMLMQNLCRELSRRLRVTNQRLKLMATENDEDNETLIRAAVSRKTKGLEHKD